ncbi:MAG TPA: hypothetical protein VND96_03995 [Candidatus Micrarchaeaceae archaeon]|nr:hypothetical protein [Candidatus Micrarchaeaceae archaeon]
MSNSTRDRIAAAFDRELGASPVPPALRNRSVHAAVTLPRHQPRQSRLLGVVAALLALAVVVTLVVSSHLLRTHQIPAGSTTPPPARGGAGVAYDQSHGVMVVFGGTPALNDTWTWDGKYWTHRHPSATPPAWEGTLMAYDSARHDAVLFGGETWIWTGATWQQKHPQHEPAIGSDWQAPTMEFDPISQTVLLYGFTSDYGAETWSWNGSDWAQLRPSTTPTSAGTMAYDGHQILLLAASSGQVGGRYLTQTWAWDGSNWDLLNPKVNLPLLGSVSTAYDPQRSQLVVLTGDTWTWDGSTWSRQHPALQPPSVGYMVYMSSLHEVVSWGDVSSSLDNQMFAWDGSTWKLIEPGTAVPPSGNNGKGGVLRWLTPAAAEAKIRASVTNTRPVLLPQSFSGTFDAQLADTSPDSFSVLYESDLRDKMITLSLNEGPNPPPATDPHARLTTVRFRGVAARYQVYDATSPVSIRWLMWNEPGTITNSGSKAPGVPYFLSTSGMTDLEFWQVANSLK